eukprot:TRINITY_DN7013_c0_g1_i1.p2 TRINITY_DN7013_c0_g1~~TRINITY_DN7013_c0_g1_i1.p2  ORF type:complete len:545 (-),score=177.94 TRINITY_DN7013_c0_g1_i1:127-1761(-)
MSSTSGSPARRCRRVLTTALAGAAALATAVSLPATTKAHSFLSMPLPISRLHGCRMGSSTLSGNGPQAGRLGRCPGPCPNSQFRPDTSPGNPAAVYRRGSKYEVRWTRNNHEGGILRWAMVPVSEMWDMGSHQRNAFHWSCWNINRFKCGVMDAHRDCYYDQTDVAYRDRLRIPDNLPDGDYVLGWTWYGGGAGPPGKQAIFGDYYDCSYVRVEGGNPLADKHDPTFSGDATGTCLATVNRPGICKREPCVPLPYVERRVPVEFEGGRRPAPIYASNFPYVATQYRYDYDYSVALQSSFTEMAVKPAGSSVRLYDIRLVDIHSQEIKWFVDLTKPIKLGYDAKLTIMAQVTGPVLKVEWFINSRKVHEDASAPFSSSGDFRGYYYELKHEKLNRRMFITARAIGASGHEDYHSVDMVFIMDGDVPPQFIGNARRMALPEAARAARLAAGKFVHGRPPMAAAAGALATAGRTVDANANATAAAVAPAAKAVARPAEAPAPSAVHATAAAPPDAMVRTAERAHASDRPAMAAPKGTRPKIAASPAA